MCAILDTNCIGKFIKGTNEDIKPVRHWIYRKNGKIVYSATEKFRAEWKGSKARDLMKELQRRSKFIEVPTRDVEEREDELKEIIKSDDEHIIALALVAKVKVLVSDDNKLIADFKEHVVQGRVYKTKSHKHLLTKDTCP